jgi:pimeloyl-ACP methyl ester carboxylesterase
MSTAALVNETVEQSANTSRKRGCLFLIGRGLLWLGIVLITVVVLGFTYQTIATEADKGKYTPRGQLYTINGRQMHIVCMGEGSPTIILQAGGGAESLWWYRIQRQLAEHTQVCAYDRAGLGWSEVASTPRDPITIVGELHALLEAANVQPPYVMAGHSYGAILARIYATQYPQEIVGIALVDSMPLEHYASESDLASIKPIYEGMQTAFSIMIRLGVGRLLVSPGMFQASGYPTEIVPELVALNARSQTLDTDIAEKGSPGIWALSQAGAAAEDLGSLPMMVLWAGLGGMVQPSLLPTREAIAAFSSNSVTRILAGADHGSILGNEQYAQQVSDAILDVIDAASTGERLS